jgi:hypothetical protein
MKEVIEIHNGKGIIHLKGGPSDTILYIKKKPRIICFHAEIGTTWRYQIGREIHENIISENYKYEEIVKSGEIDSKIKLSDTFKHILELLTNGVYELKLCEFSGNSGFLPVISEDIIHPFYEVYGGSVDVSATQSYIDIEIVKQYKEEITIGKRPIAVLIKIIDSWTIYIIDGHHKFKAYDELSINPRVLLISKMDSKKIKLTEGITTMNELGMDKEDWIEIYRKEKMTKIYEKEFLSHYSQGLKIYFNE